MASIGASSDPQEQYGCWMTRSAVSARHCGSRVMPRRSGRPPRVANARGRRATDLLIAATALTADLPLYTRSPADVAGLSGLLDIVAV